ncbi:P-type conjugative transfer ATPase TrbB [uncultured Algimonas sp.]|uniref:P-type conjugative transfer ATPase TrbB n=1 Tax=uncultured Algimonas sp. TaxID=1547920 RepID=UPI0026394FA0|nr:P-type conjugative transfer ATPase TrbB [uncultured Algimonas sp.]
MIEQITQSRLRTDTMLRSAFGPIICEALADSSVVEIMQNPDGTLWTERTGKGRFCNGQQITPEKAERIVRLVASLSGHDVTREQPIVSAELPIGGQRFEGILPPVVRAPSFAIRNHAARVFTLTDYEDVGTMDSKSANLLRAAVIARRNILIVGGTGSGKTTLANALLSEVADTGHRVLILEDTRELQCDADDCVALRTQPTVSMADLLRSTLRLRPDRIVVGEVRGGEALDLLKAWSTGHPGGVATVHANSAADGLDRLEQLVGEVVANVPRKLISAAVDIVVGIENHAGVRRVTDILEVLGGDGPNGAYRLRSMVHDPP